MKNKKYLVFCILAATHLCVTSTQGMSVLEMMQKDNKTTDAKDSKKSVTTDIKRATFSQSLGEQVVKMLFTLLDLRPDKTKTILDFIKKNFNTECELSGLKKGLFHIFPVEQIIRIKIDDFQIFLNCKGDLAQEPKKSSEGVHVEFIEFDEADCLDFELDDVGLDDVKVSEI